MGIGYTASRLAEKSQSIAGACEHTLPLVSIEVDPVHTLLARHFIDLVRLNGVVELLPGMVRDVLPSVTEAFGCSALAFVFMDQKGTSFHVDFTLLERSQSWPPGSQAVADN